MQAASPVHGRNQWPHHCPAFEGALRQYIDGCLHIGQAVMRGRLSSLCPPHRPFQPCHIYCLGEKWQVSSTTEDTNPQLQQRAASVAVTGFQNLTNPVELCSAPASCQAGGRG